MNGKRQTETQVPIAASRYESPLSNIIETLRKTHGIPAYTLPATLASIFDSNDPWGPYEAVSNQIEEPHALGFGTLCACAGSISKVAQRRRRSSLAGYQTGAPTVHYAASRRPASLSNEAEMPPATNLVICQECERVKETPVEQSGTSIGGGGSPGQQRLSKWLDSARRPRIEAPRHTDELLEANPRLWTTPVSSKDVLGAAGRPARNAFGAFLKNTFQVKGDAKDSSTGSLDGSNYESSVLRDRANRQEASELSSLLWILEHELRHEEFVAVEKGVFSALFSFVHSQEKAKRMAGLAALYALIGTPSADDDRKFLQFSNALSKAHGAPEADFEFLSAVTKALGRMTTRTVYNDFVEVQMNRALEWLRTDRSDRRLAACLALKEFAVHAPTTFYSKIMPDQGGSNQFLNFIFEALHDPQPIVRTTAADAVSHCLKILMDRQPISLTGLLCQVYASVMRGFEQEKTKSSNWTPNLAEEAKKHGSLLLVGTMVAQTQDFMLPRYDEVCQKVLEMRTNPELLIQLEVVRLLPRLARRSPKAFARRYLDDAIDFLLEKMAASQTVGVIDLRPSAFYAIGDMVLAMVDPTNGSVVGASLPTLKIREDPKHPGERLVVELARRGVIQQNLNKIFSLVSHWLRSRISTDSASRIVREAVFHCTADLVEALGEMAETYITGILNDMFHAGLSNDLIQCLHAIAECMPSKQSEIEDRLLQEVSKCLAGIRSARVVCDPLFSARASSKRSPSIETVAHRVKHDDDNTDQHGRNSAERAETDGSRIIINMSTSQEAVTDLVLSLQTLGSFGDSLGRVTASGTVVPLLPFVQHIAAQYVEHPRSEVRRAAALTCCSLLVPPALVLKGRVGGYSGRIVEAVLGILLRTAVSDPSAGVRLCVVRALDTRYDRLLCQAHHLQPFFLLLQDEILATRVAALRLIGRLASLNPAPILPFMRKFLLGLVIELECGVETGKRREEAARLLVVFLQSKSLQKLVLPILPSLVSSLPLDGATPRLASAALEALGELARAVGTSLQPWVPDLFPVILGALQDQSSSGKQRTSLRTLSLIAGSTGYVVQPYLDYPNILLQATDILPGTKRAPWTLKREVFRTLGTLGALDPDRYLTVAPKSRIGGSVGGAYFVGEDDPLLLQEAVHPGDVGVSKTIPKIHAGIGCLPFNYSSVVEADDNLPVHLFMYEQYAMVALPVSDLVPSRRMTPFDDDFYPTVAVQALMRIFKDPALSQHHGSVMQAIMFIFKSLGVLCVNFLDKVMPHIMTTIRTCGPANLRESLLQQVTTLSEIVREHLRPYVTDIFEVVELFWSSRHIATILGLVLHLAVGVPDSFRLFVPRLLRRILTSLEEMHISDWVQADLRHSGRIGEVSEPARLALILSTTKCLRNVLGEYGSVLVQAQLKLTETLLRLLQHQGNTQQNWDLASEVVDLIVSSLSTTSAILECEGIDAVGINQPCWSDKSGVCIHAGDQTAGVVQRLVRMLRDNELDCRVALEMVATLCVCVKQLGCSKWLTLYHISVRSAILEWREKFLSGAEYVDGSLERFSAIPDDLHPDTVVQKYDDVILELNKGDQQHMSYNELSAPYWRNVANQNAVLLVGNDPVEHNVIDEHMVAQSMFDPSMDAQNANFLAQQGTNQARINQKALQSAWACDQCASRDDWDSWMRRLAIELLKEAPSQALRATANLAQAYQPLSRELFSAAFVCCWKELSPPFRTNLVYALERAFKADVSPEILQTLLNLAEFMEHDPTNALPIDIEVLADLALKCRAYAKVLHYKEREHRLGRLDRCVEDLISVNRKLDLPEAALGVLKSTTMRQEASKQVDTGLPSESVDVGKHHHTQNELFYSVVWRTEHRTSQEKRGLEILDLSENKEEWLAKLGSWTEALEVYETKLEKNPKDFDAIFGCMRCLTANGEWKRVLDLAKDNWRNLPQSTALGGTSVGIESGVDLAPDTDVTARGQRKAIRMCAEAAWRLGCWDDLENYSSMLGQSSRVESSNATTQSGSPIETAAPKVEFDGAFFSAVLHIHRKEWKSAAAAIDAARKAMGGRFTALMAESYNRAYPSMVTAQTLAEMEEIIHYRQNEDQFCLHLTQQEANFALTHSRQRLLSVWRDRLAGCRLDAEVHSSILAVHSLILGPTEEIEATLTLSDLSRQAQRYKLAERVLLDPLLQLGANFAGREFGCGVSEALQLRGELEARQAVGSSVKVIEELVTIDTQCFFPSYSTYHEKFCQDLVKEAGGPLKLEIKQQLYFALLKHRWLTDHKKEALDGLVRLCDVVDLVSHCSKDANSSLCSACWLELSDWKMEEFHKRNKEVSVSAQIEILRDCKRAVLTNNEDYKAWHAWARINFRLTQQSIDREDKQTKHGSHNRNDQSSIVHHVEAATRSYLKAIALGTKRWSASVQQDMLNLLTCIFKFGDRASVIAIFNESINSVAIETWLGVLPQLLARIQIRNKAIRVALHQLLVRIGEKHPQALMYPLSVLLKSPVIERKNAAESLMKSLRSHSSALVEDALMVSSELIRVAILWLETWQGALEDASHHYYVERNVTGMLDLLFPLHEQLERGGSTQVETEFIQNHGEALNEAHIHLKRYKKIIDEAQEPDLAHAQGEADTAMNKVWQIYYKVFRSLNKLYPHLTKLALDSCSPALHSARSLELGVPGSYRVDGSFVKIERFVPSVNVINSKQRPRKITLRGSDGKNYVFLLKGHEDLRQDERVMQLFGLVNAHLERDRQTKKHDLRIQRYAICPLSHDCGLVGWVPHTDTLHVLIKDYRKQKMVPLNLEHLEMTRLAPNHSNLTVMQKVQVFCDALRKTTGNGNDMYETLWLKSKNSEEWLERRTRFTRSLAVMSMVGYILGLGDRHPSNLMLDKLSGRVLHIDFGDCFEVACMREKFPEKVPFRLTRMLIKAMEVSGIEGSYRSTCERTMTVLRDNQDTLVAMLEAFVYDPLFSWRLRNLSAGNPEDSSKLGLESETTAVAQEESQPTHSMVQHDAVLGSLNEEGDEDRQAQESHTTTAPNNTTGMRSMSVHRPPHPGRSNAAMVQSLQMYSDFMRERFTNDDRVESVTAPGTTTEGATSHRVESRVRQRDAASLMERTGDVLQEEAVNEKAIEVIQRVQDKLDGTDFPDRLNEDLPLDVVDQVQRLIVQATSVENLCQMFVGWCPFW